MTKVEDLLEEKISFHSEDIDFVLSPTHQAHIVRWLFRVAADEQQEIASLGIVFCSDDYLHKVNVEYLDHDTYTDVITFPYAEDGAPIEGDILLSIDRVRENAAKFRVQEEEELHRILVHGLLHLLGYEDKRIPDQKIMIHQENTYLKKYADS